MRDSLLAVSGALDPAIGGPAAPITEPPFSTRRTIYGFIDRQNLDGLYRTFDFAVPDATSPRRFVTTVPQQALFLMNSPFLHEQTRRLTASIGLEPGGRRAGVAIGLGRRSGRGGSPSLSPRAGPVARARRAQPGNRVRSPANRDSLDRARSLEPRRQTRRPTSRSRPGSS